MLTNSRSVRIEWGDCDPKGIVFYPRYFAIFDECTAHLFERALGITKFQMMQELEFSGWLLVDTRGRFLIPSRFGDDLVVESSVQEFRRSSFDLRHRMLKNGELAVEGIETRVWTSRDPQGRLKGTPVPDWVKARFA